MKLWVSTQNRHKVEEIGAILGPGVSISSLLDLPGFPEVEENGATYRDNALLKARALWNHQHEPVFADDSGLEVDALAGRPGVHSSRYSAPNPSSAKNIEKLLRELQGVSLSQRSARFRCTVVYIDAAGQERTFEGVLEGLIWTDIRGEGGFGFDPVFWLPERSCTVAELPADEKNRISHRGKAVAALKRFLDSLPAVG